MVKGVFCWLVNKPKYYSGWIVVREKYINSARVSGLASQPAEHRLGHGRTERWNGRCKRG